MIKRLVKMTFDPALCDQFDELFERYKEKIRSTHGCSHLELWKDIDYPNVYFTYSHWDSVGHLEGYRHSTTFKEVWPMTKKLFIAPAEVWTINEKIRL